MKTHKTLEIVSATPQGPILGLLLDGEALEIGTDLTVSGDSAGNGVQRVTIEYRKTYLVEDVRMTIEEAE